MLKRWNGSLSTRLLISVLHSFHWITSFRIVLPCAALSASTACEFGLKGARSIDSEGLSTSRSVSTRFDWPAEAPTASSESLLVPMGAIGRADGTR
ncbi:unnamed protein product, partial [Mycena citricolor]